MANSAPPGSIRLDVKELRRYGRFDLDPCEGTHSVQTATLDGDLERSATTTLQLDEDTHALLLIESGATLFRYPHRKWALATHGTIAMAHGPNELVAVYGPGEHRAEIYWWGSALTPQIEAWLRATDEGAEPIFVCHPIRPKFETIVGRLQGALADDPRTREMTFLSAIYELFPHLARSPSSFQLAILPTQMPDRFGPLVEKVRALPNRSWSLRDSADAVGYSAFHFSRAFKGFAGYGFPEFVDRCRTEKAVSMLCDTGLTLEEIVSRCGLASVGALRESLREYVGLAAQDLRANS